MTVITSPASSTLRTSEAKRLLSGAGWTSIAVLDGHQLWVATL